MHIASTGSSAQKQPQRLGHYIKMAGKWINGRPVWKQNDNKHKNKLFYSGNYFHGGLPHPVSNFSVCLSSNVHICVHFSLLTKVGKVYLGGQSIGIWSGKGVGGSKGASFNLDKRI